MKHRSPLITLAAVALAFAIMFIVNMTVSPPGSGSTGIPSPPAAPATATAGSPSAIETSADSPSHEDSKFPEKIVYAGRAEDNAGAIAVAVLGDHATSTGADSTHAPELNPGNPQVTVDGENLNAAPVNGDEDL